MHSYEVEADNVLNVQQNCTIPGWGFFSIIEGLACSNPLASSTASTHPHTEFHEAQTWRDFSFHNTFCFVKSFYRRGVSSRVDDRVGLHKCRPFDLLKGERLHQIVKSGRWTREHR